MRHPLRTIAAIAAAAGVVFACGSSDQSVFPTSGEDAGAVVDNPPGTFVADGGTVGQTACKPQTCADVGANCGPIGDGCGGVVECGACSGDETCGGGGKPSVCGKPACATTTCAALGANCGLQGDGCGGSMSCWPGGGSSCPNPGDTCGGGGPSKCGPGGGGDGGGGDGGACVPTKTGCASGDCGFIADGCGGGFNCPTTCPAGQTCGGGGTPSLCGAPPCTKKTCGTADCGYVADGCGDLLNCWGAGGVCLPGQTCGGGGTANVCGTPASCTGLCLQQQMCAGGGTTSIEGYVTSPNGVLPVPNAVVYVPNGAVAAFVPGVACETCATASGSPLVSVTTDANGHFLLPNMPVSTAGKVVNIPVVIQLGRWRKQLTVQTAACTNTKIPAVNPANPAQLASGGARPSPDNVTGALARTKNEGDIPLTAISTGAVDGLECVFRKMGVADSEFTNGAGTGRIRLYQDPAEGGRGWTGGCAPGCGSNCSNSGSAGCPRADVLYCPNGRSGTSKSAGGGYGAGVGCKTGGGAPNEIDKFDAAIFGCVGDQSNKGIASRDNVIRYANAGGRVFATHYSYVWLYSTAAGAIASGSPAYSSAWAPTANAWNPDSASWDAKPSSLTTFIDTSFPKGVLFANWLQAPVAPTSAAYPPPYAAVNGLYATNPPTIALTEPRADIVPAAPNLATSGIVAPAQRWVYATGDHNQNCATNADCRSGVCSASRCVGSVVFDPGSNSAARDAPMHYTFNTDLTKPAAQQCGRVLYSDFHVSIGWTENRVFPSYCGSGALTAQEKVLAYMLFDLASCVATTPPPACTKKTCAELGIGCGPSGDGCGGTQDCGNCPDGQTCGGGGIANQCGAPACAPKTCQIGQCGLIADGCGKSVDCGGCGAGTCGGGGTPNECGSGTCNPLACPTPASGSACGPVANGCGGLNNCPCEPNVPCVNGKCGAPPCTPTSCEAQGKNCGQIADGCGKILDCGICVAPQTCGGGGLANVCGGGVN